MLPSEELQAQALRDGGGHRYDFRPMLSTVASILRSADWAICHQETPISDNDRGLSGYPDFNAPHELAAAERWAGYDACDTASNHTVDLGAAGVTATLDALDAVHIAHTGSARSPAEAAKPAIYDVKGVKVGHIAYTYGLNGNADPHPWTVNLIDIARIKAAARELKVAGADIVVVSVHAGIELDQSPSAYQVQIDDEIMSSPDVDLIVGAHAHVVQPIRRLADGRWIVYGVGNLLAQQAVPSNDPTPPHRDGVIVEATISRHNGTYRVSRMGYVPTFVDAPSDKVELAPPFSRRRTVTALTAVRAPLVDLTPR
ncbi:MAG: CapA family protein [Mycobacteriales bacterium]